MKRFVIKKGHNLIVEGAPDKTVVDVKDSNIIAFNPSAIKNNFVIYINGRYIN